jgi:hypothetical protein
LEARRVIKLGIEILSPLTPDDHELLSGIAVMTLAIANHELAKARFPEAFGDEPDAADDATPREEVDDASDGDPGVTGANELPN